MSYYGNFLENINQYSVEKGKVYFEFIIKVISIPIYNINSLMPSSERSKFIIVILFLLVFFPFTNLSVTNAQSSTSIVTSSDTLTQEQTIRELEIQNRLLADYNHQTISMLQWSLTFAAIFLLSILGLIGYFTQRRFQADKENLKEHVQKIFSELKADVKKDTDRKFLNFKNEHDDKIDQLNKNLKELAEITITKKIEPLKTKVTSLSSSISNQETRINDKITDLEIEILEIQAKAWEEKEIFSNGISAWIRIATKSLKINNKFQLSTSLDNIERLLKKDMNLDSYDKSDLTSLLNKLPSDFAVIGSSIKGKI